MQDEAEGLGDGAEEAIEMAKEKGVRIVTIGVGTEKGGLIPLKNASGTISGYKKDQKGENVITKLYPEVLKNIATQTKSKYIVGTNTKEVVEEVKNALDKLRSATRNSYKKS